MSSRRSENLSDFKLIGGTIKLSERPPSSSHSSISKKFYLSKFSSRPSSAFPRLCSGGNSQDELASLKNDRRPFSADFVMPNPLSGKSKETLTDGSFESIYVPVDFQLPSSNLFKELMEQDIEEWRSFEMENSLEMKGKTLSEHSIPTLVTSDSERTNLSKREEGSTRDKTQKNEDLKEIDNKELSQYKAETDKTNNIIEKCLSEVDESTDKNQAVRYKEEEVSKPSEEELPDHKYTMTPGLTTKPPIPKKTFSHATIVMEENDSDPIYDYFAIKYNFRAEAGTQNLREVAERPICEEIPEEIDGKEGFGGAEEKGGEMLREKFEVHEDKSRSPIKPNEEKYDTKNDHNYDVDDWLEEINMNNVHLKESETDKYLQEVRKQCKASGKDENLNDLPLLSEIDIDDLFKLDDMEETPQVGKDPQVAASSPSPASHTRDKVTSKKRPKSKSPIPKKNRTTKNPNSKKGPEDKNEKENKASTKSKFTDKKVNASNSPKHETPSIEDNVETWIGKDARKNRVEFSELLDCVEDLKATTEMLDKNAQISCAEPMEEMKQGNYDDIETIIEALENQDKTSQQNIQTIKKIVTSELSNSLILNENEKNLEFRKNEEKLDSPKTSKSPGFQRQDNDSGRSSSLDFSRSNRSSRNERFEHHEHHQFEAGDASRLGRSQSAEGRHHCESMRGIGSYRDLLSYLDEVDKKCNETLEVAKERAQTASKLVLESSGLFDTIPRVEDLVTHSSEELSSFVIDLSLRVKDKTSCISLLQNELSTLREKLLNQTKQAEANLRQKLQDQKEETERIARRHQKFIDQLMEEKKTLARKCEELVEEMHTMEEKYVSNMRAIEHRHQVEMQKMKDMQAASEKLRRERWIEGRTQKIKEMAVKSIEPEVERMEKRHQEELSNLRMVHKREIEELELRAARKLQEHSENLREQLIEDREKALAHERDVMRLRYEKMVESEERNYQDQRRRLLADHSNRMAECEEREAQAAAEKERAIKQAHEEFEEKLQAAARRHANEMKIVKETAAIEMENWKNSFRKQQSALLMEKETAIRRECKRERDREIELVIEKLENESNKARSQIEQTTENRIKRLKEKYEMEIRDLEMLEKDAQTKYCESRSKLLEYEEVVITLRNTIKQLEQQLTEEKLKRSKLESEREEAREDIRKEYEDRLRVLEREAEELRISADKQVEQLYSRVRVSLARKDELLAELTNDHKALKEKCLYLENMMEQQRKEYMINT